VTIKRTIALNLVKSIQDISNETFKKDLAESMFKFHQTHKLDNNANNHPVLKVYFKIFGFANSKVNNPIGDNRSKNLLQQKEIKQEIVIRKEQGEVADFKTKNIEKVKKIRES